MIPIRLTIEGLYSYQKRQTVDFTDLTTAGLFGVFGATGSGKSSILEAISYALYGKVERLHNRELKYNVMNLRSDRLFIEFEFYNYDNEHYRVTCESKRNSKRFEDIRTPTKTFYQWVDQQWKPIEISSAEGILGNLAYDNFKRTIIIPQGKFREFLELGGTDRVAMMEEIFQLHRFDLSGKTKKLEEDNKTKLNKVTGILSKYEDVTKEAIAEKNEEYEAVKKQFAEKDAEYKEVDEQYQKQKNLKENFEDLQQKKKKSEKLTTEKESIDKKEKEIAQYEEFYNTFFHLLERLSEYKSTLDDERKKEKRVQDKYQSSVDCQKDAQAELDNINPYFEKIDQKRKEETELQNIIEIHRLSDELKECQKKTQESENELQAQDKDISSVQEQIQELESKREELKGEKLDTKLLQALSSWYQEAKSVIDKIQEKESGIKAKKKEREELLGELENKNIDPSNFEEWLKGQRQKLRSRKGDLEEQKTTLTVQKKLGEHAAHLKNGEPCPLCGAKEHPNVVKPKDISANQKKVGGELKEIDKELNELSEKEKFFIAQKSKLENIESSINQENSQLKTLNEDLTKHHKTFKWDRFNPDDRADFEKRRDESHAIESQLENLEKQISERRKEEEEGRKLREKLKDALSRLKQEEETKSVLIKEKKANIAILNIADYEEMAPAKIKNVLNELKKKNEDIQKRHADLSDKIQQLEVGIASLKANLENANKQVEKAQGKINEVEGNINDKLKDKGIQEIGRVEEVLKKKIDVSTEKEIIRAFRENFNQVESEIKSLEKKISEAKFTPEAFQKIETKWSESKTAYESLNKKCITLENELSGLKKDFEEKEKEERLLKRLEKRQENLQTLLNLFKGKGFVKYASTLHLSQLCDQANVRFRQMTRNHYSLQLSKNNDFEIIDYLNEGKVRSVKSLSGGQFFQASLSLALALADSVQVHAKAEKKFFFIDEGFGTQGEEDVNVVFETLLQLNKENKIIGIISHVETLKDRVSKSLMIKMDEKEGSIITSGL